MKQTITMHCECCHKVFELDKTSELPAHVFVMHCNFCIECDFAGRMDDYYNEWWDEDENGPDRPPPIPDDPNQLCMPFVFDEIGIEKVEPETVG